MADGSIVGDVFGPVHRAWMSHPKRAAVLALVWYFFVIGSALALGILWNFHSKTIACASSLGAEATPGGSSVLADGFSVLNWGVLFLFALPLAAFLMGYYFRVIDRALGSLDKVIKPVGASDKPFTKFLAEHIRSQWSTWIFPLAVAAPVVFTIIADGRNILAPLQLRTILPSCMPDWSSVGYAAHASRSALWYFGFNLIAWTMQLFLGYCGVLVLALSGGALGTVFRYGLGKKDIIDLFRRPGDPPSPERYQPVWQYGDKRCGLGALDVVFLMFVGLGLFALVASAASIFKNVYLEHHATLGSFILAVGTMVFIPFAFFWVFAPYFSHFPADYPNNFGPEANSKPPNPWPFGSEKFSWTLIGITASFWFFLLGVILRSFFPGFPGK